MASLNMAFGRIGRSHIDGFKNYYPVIMTKHAEKCCEFLDYKYYRIIFAEKNTPNEKNILIADFS